MSRAFKAHYPGQCALCPEPIRKGDMVRITEHDQTLIHDECSDTSHIPINGRRPVLCTDCMMEHRGECP